MIKGLRVILILALGVLYVLVSKFDLDNNIKSLGLWGGLAISQLGGLLPMASKRIMVRSVAMCCVALSGIVTFNSLTEDARTLIYVNKQTARLEALRPTSHEINDCWSKPAHGPDSCKSELLIEQRDRINKQIAALPKVDGPEPTQKQWIMWAGTAFLMPFALLALGVVINEQLDDLIRKNPQEIANTNSTITNPKANRYKLGRKSIQIPSHIKLSDYQLGVMAAAYESMLKDTGDVTKTQFWKRLKGNVPGFSNYTTPKLTWWWDNIAPVIANQKPPLRKRIWARLTAKKDKPVPKPKETTHTPAYQRGKVTEYIPEFEGSNVTRLHKREITV